ncbi:rCG37121 [Rattus norvegicus]|uniref:RCG37121 n=1 Tax=Rattus norvegicus TaxID=10116 RepID=A6HU28_RAT|nr:rCG37121 [Rattus norvegicus]
MTSSRLSCDCKGLRVIVELVVQGRLILKSYLLPLLWSSKPWKSHQETERCEKKTLAQWKCHI